MELSEKHIKEIYVGKSNRIEVYDMKNEIYKNGMCRSKENKTKKRKAVPNKVHKKTI